MSATDPVYISAGSFGAIYVVQDLEYMSTTANNIAIKVVQRNTAGDERDLNNEFVMMKTCYNHLIETKCDYLFSIPAPFECSQKSDSAIFQRLERTTYAGNASYSMARLHELSLELSDVILRQVPQRLWARCRGKGTQIAMCRLYFGRQVTWQRKHWVNLRNFPIDVKCYEALRRTDDFNDLPSSKQVAAGMGKMLGAILNCGYDGRDIEFVLSGRSHSSSCAKTSTISSSSCEFHVLDFNQMRRVSLARDRVQEDAKILVEAYKLNDPYFPRPHDSYWTAFKAGYTSETMLTKAFPLSQAFFKTLEQNVQV